MIVWPLLLLSASAAWAQLNATRLAVRLTPAALSAAAADATAQLSAYVSSHEPLALPDQSVPILGLTTLKLTHLELSRVAFDAFELVAVDAVGLQLRIDALSGALAFDADWLLTSVSSVAEFNASLTAVVAVAPGADLLAPPIVSLASLKFRIASLSFHNTSSAIWQVIFDFTDEIASIVSSSVESTVPPLVAADLAALLSAALPFVTAGNEIGRAHV